MQWKKILSLLRRFEIRIILKNSIRIFISNINSKNSINKKKRQKVKNNNNSMRLEQKKQEFEIRYHLT